MKTVRFADVVARCGKPHAHAFWVAPEHDREFLAARKANRVMTVAPLAPGRADVGTIGFDEARAKSGQVLLFPKSLHAFEGAHVVGVKFEQLEQPPLVAGEQEVPKPASHRMHATPPKVPHHEDQGSSAQSPRERLRPPDRSRTPAMPEKGHRENLHREEPSAPRKGVRAHRSKETHRATADDNALRREVLAAIEELKDGKAVAAYERLKRAIQR